MSFPSPHSPLFGAPPGHLSPIATRSMPSSPSMSLHPASPPYLSAGHPGAIAAAAGGGGQHHQLALINGPTHSGPPVPPGGRMRMLNGGLGGRSRLLTSPASHEAMFSGERHLPGAPSPYSGHPASPLAPQDAAMLHHQQQLQLRSMRPGMSPHPRSASLSAVGPLDGARQQAHPMQYAGLSGRHGGAHDLTGQDLHGLSSFEHDGEVYNPMMDAETAAYVQGQSLSPHGSGGRSRQHSLQAGHAGMGASGYGGMENHGGPGIAGAGATMFGQGEMCGQEENDVEINQQVNIKMTLKGRGRGSTTNGINVFGGGAGLLGSAMPGGLDYPGAHSSFEGPGDSMMAAHRRGRAPTPF